MLNLILPVLWTLKQHKSQTWTSTTKWHSLESYLKKYFNLYISSIWLHGEHAGCEVFVQRLCSLRVYYLITLENERRFGRIYLRLELSSVKCCWWRAACQSRSTIHAGYQGPAKWRWHSHFHHRADWELWRKGCRYMACFSSLPPLFHPSPSFFFARWHYLFYWTWWLASLASMRMREAHINKSTR